MRLKVITPTRTLTDTEVDEVVLPGILGELGVLPGHAPLLTSLGIGELAYHKGLRYNYMAIAGGYAEILPDRVIVLADIGEKASEIDVSKAEQDLIAAEKAAKVASGKELVKAQAKMLKAITRLKVAKRVSQGS